MPAVTSSFRHEAKRVPSTGARRARLLPPLVLAALAACGDVAPPSAPIASPEPRLAAQPLKGTWTVTTLDEPGEGSCTSSYCTLRQAVAAAQDGDRIVFKSTLRGTIKLASSLQLGKPLQIDGGRRITLDTEGRDIVASVFSEGVELSGVTLTGGTLGAIFGPWLASQLARPFGTPVLLAVAAGFIVVALGPAWWLTRLRGDGTEPAGDGSVAPQAGAHEGVIGGSAWEGFRSVFRSPYLLAICAYVLIVAIMATFIYFTRLQMVAALGTDIDMRTAAFARIDMLTQAATLLLQAVVTGHLMKRLGVSVTLALLPLTAALGFTGLAVVGSIAALIAFEATFRAVQRGIMRPARETLFTVVPRADRYKAKAFIDTFVYRTGDVVGAQTEGLLGRLGMGLAALAAFAVPLAAAWMALGLWLGYAQRARAARWDSKRNDEGASA